MKETILRKVMESHYCKIVFVISLVLIYLLTPKKIFYGYYAIIGIIFMILTSLIITCFTREIKDKVVSARRNGKSILGIITIVLGFSALQTCAVGAPVCGASIGMGIVSLIFPGIALNFLEKYSIHIIILASIIQAGILYSMNCFKTKNFK